jgi:hypothetical protein
MGVLKKDRETGEGKTNECCKNIIIKDKVRPYMEDEESEVDVNYEN